MPSLSPSFTAPCVTTVIMALVSLLRWNTDSEDEELETLKHLDCNLRTFVTA